jgi:hypothetical protein
MPSLLLLQLQKVHEMKEPDFEHINDAAFDDLMRQYMLEDNSVLTDEALNAGSEYVYSTEATAKPSAEKEAALLEQLAASAGTTVWWSKTWVIVTAIVLAIGGGYLLIDQLTNEMANETAAKKTVEPVSKETTATPTTVTEKTDPTEPIKTVVPGVNPEPTEALLPVVTEESSKSKEEETSVKENPFSMYGSSGDESNDGDMGGVSNAGNPGNNVKTTGEGERTKTNDTDNPEDELKSGSDGGGDVSAEAKDEDLKLEKKKTAFYQAPKGQVNPKKNHTFSPGKTSGAMLKYVGDYRNPKTGEVYKFRVKKGTLVAKGKGMHDLELLSVNEDGTTIPVFPEDKKVILFTRGSTNVITGFYYSDIDVKNDRFEKVIED